jgi:hypothetical protein
MAGSLPHDTDIRWLSVAQKNSSYPYRIRGTSKPSAANTVQPSSRFFRHFGTKDGLDLIYCWTLENQRKAEKGSSNKTFASRDKALGLLNNFGRGVVWLTFDHHARARYICLGKFQDCDLSIYFRLSKLDTFNSLSDTEQNLALQRGYVRTDVIKGNSCTVAYCEPTNPRHTYLSSSGTDEDIETDSATDSSSGVSDEDFVYEPSSKRCRTAPSVASFDEHDDGYFVYIVTLEMYAVSVTEDRPHFMKGRYVGICGSGSDRCNVHTDNYEKHETLKRLVPNGYNVTKVEVQKEFLPEVVKDHLGGIEFNTFRRVCRETNETQEHGCLYVRGSAFTQDSFGEPHRRVGFGIIDRALEDVYYNGSRAGQKFGASA